MSVYTDLIYGIITSDLKSAGSGFCRTKARLAAHRTSENILPLNLLSDDKIRRTAVSVYTDLIYGIIIYSFRKNLFPTLAPKSHYKNYICFPTAWQAQPVIISLLVSYNVQKFTERSDNMKLNMKRFEFKRLRTRIPALIVLLGCFTVIAATADYSQMSVRASTSHVTNKKTIVLDAGHGGTDSGAVGINGELEKNINLAIVRDLSDMLTLSGFNVVLTRDSDISIHDEGVKGTREQKVSDMKNRLDIINKYGDCLFLSIHQNKFTEPEYFGAQIFYTANNPDNRMIAQIMQDNFKTIQPGNDRQIKQEGDELYLFKNTKIPAVLIECGFLSNPDDAANLSDTDYQRKVAYTIYNGILTYLTSKPADNAGRTEISATGIPENSGDITSSGQ